MSHDINQIKIIFYDGDCALCNRFIQFIIKFDRREIFYYSPLGGKLAKENLSIQSSDTVILLDQGVENTRSEAALLILKKLPLPISLLYAFKIIPKFFRDFIYKLIANNRYRFFKGREQCIFPSESVRKRFI